MYSSILTISFAHSKNLISIMLLTRGTTLIFRNSTLIIVTILKFQDASDERNCPVLVQHFMCDNGEEVEIDQVCNGINDCSDQSDEGNCPEIYG